MLQDINRQSKGINLDVSPEDQPKGTGRYRKNMVNNQVEGAYLLSNELSNEQCKALPVNTTLVNSCYINNNEHVVFLVTDDGVSEIGVIKQNCDYQSLVTNECLGFSTQYPIDSSFRLRLGCERTIYFTQENKPPRVVILDKLSSFYTKEYFDWDCIKGEKPDFVGEKWDCEKFNLIRNYKTPCFKDAVVETGGVLPSGSYNAGVLYSDSNLNKTNPIYSSQTINIYNDNETKSYFGIQGSSNIASDPLSGQYPTNKRITFYMDNLDDNFTYYHLLFFEASSGTGEVTKVYLSPQIPISQNEFTVDGNFSGWTTVSQDDISFDKLDISSATHIDQIENKLILADIKERDINYCDFQRFASKICATYKINEIDALSTENHGDPKCPETPFDMMSLLRDEVYAPHIVYEFDGGGVSPAFPIIPRGKDYFPCTSKKIVKIVQKNCLIVKSVWDKTQSSCKGLKYSIKYTVNGVEFNKAGKIGLDEDTITIYCGSPLDVISVLDFAYQPINAACTDPQIDYFFITKKETVIIDPGEPGNNCNDVEGHDSQVITEWIPDMEFIIPKSQEDEYNLLPDSQKLQKWQVYNTARKGVDNSGDFGYYECRNSMYPMRKTCDNSDYWGFDACGKKVEGNIRWFRTPGTDIEPLTRKEIVNTETTIFKIQVTLSPAFPITPPPSIDVTFHYKEKGVSKVIQKTFTNLLPVKNYTYDMGEYNGPPSDITNIVVSFSPSSPDVKIKGFVVKKITSETKVKLRILGFEFNNIQYPHPSIVGHHFVIAKREQQNKTVLDKGLTGKLKENNKYLTFSYFTRGNNSQKSNWLWLPNYLYKNQIDKPDTLKVESKWNFINKSIDEYSYDQPGGNLKDVDILIGNRQQYYGDEEALPQSNYYPNKYASLNAIAFDNTYRSPLQTINLSQTNKILVADTTEYIPNYGNDIAYVSLKVNRDVYCNLDSLVLQRMHNCVLKNTSPNIVFGGDTYIVPFEPINVLFREFYEDFLDDFLKILFIAAAVTVVVLTLGAGTPGAVAIAGAINSALALGIGSGAIATAAIVAGVIGVTAQAITGIVNAYKDSLLSELAQDSEIDNEVSYVGDFIAYAGERLDGIWIESDMNLALRLNENHACGKVYNTSNFSNFAEYLKDKILYFDANENSWISKQIICPESYRYNPDYSRLNMQSVYFPLDITYDCCSKCKNEFPHRVYASEQSFQEEFSDNYRRILPNNYIDIQGNTGKITDLFTKSNTLYVVTPECTYAILPNIQERTTNQIVSFLGTGDFFAIPPRKLSDDNTGSVGSIDKWATLKTKFGVFTVDQHENKVYLFSSAIEDISKKGLVNYFKQNLRPVFQNEFKDLFGYDYPFANNPIHNFGTGVHSTFDYENSRFIITKIDYRFTAGAKKEVTLFSKGFKNEQLFFDDRIGMDGNPINKWTILKNGEYEVIEFSNKDYFENLSFTMSFSMLTGEWTSWHSYLPYKYIYDQSKFISLIKEDNIIWKHNSKGRTGSFYGKNEPSVFEYVINNNPLVSQMTESLIVQAKVQVYDPVTREYKEVNNKFFDSLIAYNSRQTTGKQGFIIKDDSENKEDYLTNTIENSFGNIIINRTEFDWAINDLRDYRIDYDNPIFTSDWEAIKDEFPIDKVLNSSTIDFNKDWTELGVLRDKYLILRFETKNDTDTLFLIKYQVNFNSQSPH